IAGGVFRGKSVSKHAEATVVAFLDTGQCLADASDLYRHEIADLDGENDCERPGETDGLQHHGDEALAVCSLGALHGRRVIVPGVRWMQTPPSPAIDVDNRCHLEVLCGFSRPRKSGSFVRQRSRSDIDGFIPAPRGKL